MKRTVLGLTILLAASTPASAAKFMSTKPETKGVCELTCTYKESFGPKLVATCTNEMTATQCKVTADHKNTSDAYPNKMSCAAKLSETCEAAREF